MCKGIYFIYMQVYIYIYTSIYIHTCTYILVYIHIRINSEDSTQKSRSF